MSLDGSVWRVARDNRRVVEQVAEPTASGAGQGGLVVVDDARVYWVANALRSAPKQGGPTTVLFDEVPVWGLTQDDSALYFTTGSDGRVLKLAK